jgi:hypothetical protein
MERPRGRAPASASGAFSCARAVRLVRITKPNARPSRRRTFWERPSHALPDRGIEGRALWCRLPVGLQAALMAWNAGLGRAVYSVADPRIPHTTVVVRWPWHLHALGLFHVRCGKRAGQRLVLAGCDGLAFIYKGSIWRGMLVRVFSWVWTRCTTPPPPSSRVRIQKPRRFCALGLFFWSTDDAAVGALERVTNDVCLDGNRRAPFWEPPRPPLPDRRGLPSNGTTLPFWRGCCVSGPCRPCGGLWCAGR